MFFSFRLQYKIPVNFFFGCALKPAAVGGFLKQKIWTFFILIVDERSLGTKVFMISMNQKP